MMTTATNAPAEPDWCPRCHYALLLNQIERLTPDMQSKRAILQCQPCRDAYDQWSNAAAEWLHNEFHAEIERDQSMRAMDQRESA